MSVATGVRELADSRELVRNLTRRELRGKYRGSVLGWGWSLLNPLATMLVYTFVFSLLLRIAPPTGENTGITNFAVFLLCGLLAWNLFSGGLNGGAAALVSNANLIKKVYFPRETLVVAVVSAMVVTFGIEMLVLGVALLFFGHVVLTVLPTLLLLTALLSLFTLGCALLVSVLNVYFRDVQYFIGIGLQILFYATPIIYPIEFAQRFGQQYSFAGVTVFQLYQANPLVAFVEGFRDALYHDRFPPVERWTVMTVWTVLAVVVGYLVFQRYEGRLAEEL